eukprot:gene4111-163_t
MHKAVLKSAKCGKELPRAQFSQTQIDATRKLCRTCAASNQNEKTE